MEESVWQRLIDAEPDDTFGPGRFASAVAAPTIITKSP
jgi:hypothetical protein